MGGSKFQKAVDPIGAWVHGRFQKSKPSKKGGGDEQATAPDPMIALMAQMQANQAKQAQAAQKAQEEAIIESQRQSALASARQGEMAAQQTLSQAGAMQQARDIAAQQAQQQSAMSAGTSAIGGAYDIGKAKQEQAANLAGMGAIPTGAALPFYGMGDTAMTTPSTRPANIFNLPKSNDLTFGGQ